MKKISLDNNKRALYIGITVAIIIGVSVLGFGAYKGINHFQAKNLIKEAESLGTDKNYEEAIKLLNKALAKAFTEGLKQEISESLEQYKQLNQDKDNYTQGLEKFNDNDWKEAIDLLSKVSSESPFYLDAQDKIQAANEEIEKQKAAEIAKKKAEEKRLAEEKKLKREKECESWAQLQVNQYNKEFSEQYSKAQRKLRNKEEELRQYRAEYYPLCIIEPEGIECMIYRDEVSRLEWEIREDKEYLNNLYKRWQDEIDRAYYDFYSECLNK